MPCTCSDDDKLIYDFFRTFSRAEYALKKTRKFLDSHQRSKPSANWGNFASTAQIISLIQNSSNSDLRISISYIEGNPPKKQIVTEPDALDWTDLRPNSDADERVKRSKFIFDCINAVRNNLFHGGKSPWNPERDLPLLRASLTILNAAIQAHPDVKNAYENE